MTLKARPLFLFQVLTDFAIFSIAWKRSLLTIIPPAAALVLTGVKNKKYLSIAKMSKLVKT